jgi:predicted nucleic acid-binding protein
MARYLLDTDAVIDFLRGIPDSVALIRRLHDSGEVLCICDIVVAEVFAGVRPETRPGVNTLLSTLTYLPTSLEAARQAGEWRYTYARDGHPLATTDTLIAATAQRHNAYVITGNVGDYPMSDVSIIALPRNPPR